MRGPELIISYVLEKATSESLKTQAELYRGLAAMVSESQRGPLEDKADKLDELRYEIEQHNKQLALDLS